MARFRCIRQQGWQDPSRAGRGSKSSSGKARMGAKGVQLRPQSLSIPAPPAATSHKHPQHRGSAQVPRPPHTLPGMGPQPPPGTSEHRLQQSTLQESRDVEWKTQQKGRVQLCTG